MQKYKKCFFWLVVCASIITLTTGCFQSAEGDQFQGTTVAESGTLPLATNTLEPSATDTEIATVEATEEATVELSPTETPTEVELALVPSATPTIEDLPLLPSETPTIAQVAVLPSSTPVILPTTAIETEDFGQGGAVDPLFLTATALVMQASAQPTVVAQVSSPTATSSPGPTQFAPSGTPVVGTDPIFLTATAIIANMSAVPQVAQVATGTPTATLEGLATQDLGQGGSDDSIFLTATALNINPDSLSSVLQVAQAQEDQEESPQQQGDVTDPLALTATSIVAGATQTAAAQLTGTAQAIIGVTTAPPLLATTQAPVVFPSNTPSTSGPIVSGADCVHEVRAEDRNLFRISLVYGVTVHEIASASGLTNINLIHVGDRLVIPGCGTTGAVPPPTSIPGSDQGGGSSSGGGVIAPCTGGGGSQIHVVQQNETLFELSLRYNVLVNDIASANCLTNINLIYIGQELAIP